MVEPQPQTWPFLNQERIWFWKTLDGYMMFEHGDESFVTVFPTAQIAGWFAKEAKMPGHPEPCKLLNAWRSAVALLDDGLAGYAWIDGESVEIYRVADMPSAALDLIQMRFPEGPNG